MKSRGYDVGNEANGKFDPKLLAAVARFQSDNNLTRDGVVGQQTWAALMGVPNADKVPLGNEWLKGWAERVRTKGDTFLKPITPANVDLSEPLKPENAVDAPMFKQGDARWGANRMSNGKPLRSVGCAVTSMAMALSAATGKTITPGELNAEMLKRGGYDQNNDIVWGAAAKVGGARATRTWSSDPGAIEHSLKAGKPVIIGVDYKNGNGTDHFVTITATGVDAKGQKVFLANDPATGDVVRFYPSPQGLRSYDGGMGNYRATGAVFLS